MEEPGTVIYTKDSAFEDIAYPTEFSFYDLICVYSDEVEIYLE